MANGYQYCAASVLAAVLLASCSGGMVPPEDIDGGIEVSSIRPKPIQSDSATLMPLDPMPRQPAAETIESAGENSDDYLDRPNLAGVGDDPARNIVPAPEIVADTPKSPMDDGVNIDNTLGVEPVSLAQEEAETYSDPSTDQPVVDGIGTDRPVALNRPAEDMIAPDFAADAQETAAEISPPSRRDRNRAEEREVAFIPRFSQPLQVPESFGGLTAAERSCRAELKSMGVVFRELPPISKGNNCGIPHPIEVSRLPGGIALKPAATINCNMARNFSKWVKNELTPAVRFRYMSGVDTIRQMGAYSCRRMNSSSRNPWSEHSKGNAIDIGEIKLKSGKDIDIRKKGFFAFREKGLLKAVRSDSCKYFTTVLGPGSDPHHKDHFHFDLRSRKSGYRHCS